MTEEEGVRERRLKDLEAMKRRYEERIKKIRNEIKKLEDEIKEIGALPATIRLRWVFCGKHCGGCPHGPYYYAYKKNSKKLEEIYIGKDSEAALASRAAMQLLKLLKKKVKHERQWRTALKRVEQEIAKLSI
jgi:prefoldin subunit 5